MKPLLVAGGEASPCGEPGEEALAAVAVLLARIFHRVVGVCVLVVGVCVVSGVVVWVGSWRVLVGGRERLVGLFLRVLGRLALGRGFGVVVVVGRGELWRGQ